MMHKEHISLGQRVGHFKVVPGESLSSKKACGRMSIDTLQFFQYTNTLGIICSRMCALELILPITTL